MQQTKTNQQSLINQDLIRLLNSEDDEQEELDVRDGCNEEIDTNQDYKETLTKIMAQIYLKSKDQSAIVMLFTI